MIVREPIVAGRFYAAHPDRCQAELADLLAQGWSVNPNAPQRRLLGGIVPHAGWAFSGAVAARVFRALATTHKPKVIVLFGSVHSYRGQKAALFSSGRWETPIGPVVVDARLAERVLGHTNQIIADVHAHEDEHSIEVQMPFIRHLFPDALVLPVMVPPTASAHEVGEAVARTLDVYQYDALVVGTTDLTHYGPRYGLTAHGVGREGNTWAKDTNDRRFLDLVLDLRATEVVAEAARHKNACSAGAVAATIRCAVALGATEATVLAHTSSSEVAELLSLGEQEDSVGYAGIVFS
jgi:MEMO1 family protein